MGDAVPGAKLDVLSPSPDGLTNTRAGRVEEVYPGLLTVHFAEDAAVTLFCRAGRHGTGRLDDVSLRTRKPWDWSPLKSAPPVQIPVFGSGQIEGHLADDSGNPSAGVEVRAVADLHGIGEASRSKLTYGIGQAELLTFGHLHAATTTDSNGYFSLSGLAADERFHLWAKEGWTSKGHLSFIGSASSKSGAAPLEAVVKRPHLVVDLLDAEGRFLTRPGSAQHRSGRNLDQPVILVYECREPGPGPGGAITSGRNIRPVRPTNHWLVPQPTLTNAENNGLVYELTTGCRYAVGVVGGGFRYKPKIIDVPAGSGQIRIAFGADARPAMREVTLAVVQDMDRELDVIVLDPVTLVPLLRRRYAARPDDAEAPRSDRLELPPGRYVVGLVGPEADPWLGGGHLGESQEFGRTEVTVDLRDQDASLCVHLERPASLEAVAHRLN